MGAETRDLRLGVRGAKIRAYYRATIGYYAGWGGSTQALHIGYWDKDTKSHAESLDNLNRLVARAAGIEAGREVLDAGCGQGGTVVWIAKNLGARVTGITIVPEQIDIGRRHASRNGVCELTRFLCESYLDTPFDDDSFDHVYAIESACYATPKTDLLAEMYRVLKTGGTFAVTDVFVKPKPMGRIGQWLLDQFREGFAIPAGGVVTLGHFKECMASVGFKNVRHADLTAGIMRSSRRVFFRDGLLVYPARKLMSLVGAGDPLLLKHAKTCLLQYAGGTTIAEYGLITAEK